MERIFRFYLESDSATNIYRECLLSLILANGTNVGTTDVVSLINAIKLNRITVWGEDEDIAGFHEASIMFFGERSPSTEFSATGSRFFPARLSVCPPKGSLAGFWSLRGHDEDELLFSYDLGSGSVIDLHVSYTLAFGSGGLSPVTAAANMDAYEVGYARLDCLNGSGAAGTNVAHAYGPEDVAVATRP